MENLYELALSQRRMYEGLEEEISRAFKGMWIPRAIWFARDIIWMEKLLLVEIDSLETAGGCFASNQYLAKFFGLSKDRISKMITNLKRLDYLSVEILYKEGTKQVEGRIIRVNQEKFINPNQYLEWKKGTLNSPVGENTDVDEDKNKEVINSPIGENTYRGIGKNTYRGIGKYAYIDIYNIDNNINSENETHRVDKKEVDEGNKDKGIEKVKKEVKPKHKRKVTDKPKANINELFENEPQIVKDAIQDFIDHRKEIKKPMTNLAIKRFINKLNRFEYDDVNKVACIEKSILRGYTDIFPLSDKEIVYVAVNKDKPIDEDRRKEIDDAVAERNRMIIERRRRELLGESYDN